jgi:hypothetical protein
MPLTTIMVSDDRMALISEQSGEGRSLVLTQAATDAIEAMLEDPGLARVPTSDASAGGVTDTLAYHDLGHDVFLELAEPVPVAAKKLVETLDDLVAHPPAQPVFDVTLTLGSDVLHTSSTSTMLHPVELAELGAMLEDPELQHAGSSELAGVGTLVTLHVTGDISIDVHHPLGHAPAVVTRFESTLYETLSGRRGPTGPASAVGGPCGGGGSSCAEGLACDYEHDCNASDMEGTCVPAVTSCAPDDTPVCACGGKTYANDCERRLAHAHLDHDGPC